jgi:hypothetical protein
MKSHRAHSYFYSKLNQTILRISYIGGSNNQGSENYAVNLKCFMLLREEVKQQCYFVN